MAGTIAAGSRETAACGQEILRAGGNAVDAAIAAALGAFVVEPLLASAGGGGIMTAVTPSREPVVIDFFSDAPGLGGGPVGELDFEGIELDFGTVSQEFHVGRGSAAVPGALSGLALARDELGSLPLSELVAPACRRARQGVVINEATAHAFSLLWPIISRDPELAGSFSTELRIPRAGERIDNPALADTLEEFGALGAVPDRVWDQIVEDFGPGRGGLISRQDVQSYAPVLASPNTFELGDWSVVTSPAVGGRLVAVIARALAGEAPAGSEAEELARFARASARGHAERQGLIAPGSTTHISVLDDRGGAASVTLTNGEGCSHLIGDTGIQLNNFLGEEDLNPHGFHRHRPGARLPTMLAPTIALHDGAPALVLGSGGANRIRTAVGQVLYRIAVGGEDPAGAVHAPRTHAEGDTVWIECEGLGDAEAVLAALGDEFDVVHPFAALDFFFGGVHTVAVDSSGRRVGVPDRRRGGEALIA